VCASVVLVWFAFRPAEVAYGQAGPNLLLIVADDLGYGDLSSYGARDISTPNLDRLAREGVRMTDFYAAAPVCTPTRAALMTGRYHQRLMFDRPFGTKEHADHGLKPTGRSLPQLLKAAGYATALIGKWHLGFRPEFHPNRHGFDYFWGFLAGYVDWYTHVRGDGQPDLWENTSAATHSGYLDDELSRRAALFMAENSRRRFFLEVSLGAPHWPWQSPHTASVAVRKNDSMFQTPADPNPATRAEYAEIVRAMDRSVGRLLETLDRLSLTHNTLVVFISDNGGEWLSRNDPFFHRKDTLWEGGIRVPAILRWPAALPAGRVSSQVGITMDLTATLVAAAGANLPMGAQLDGANLVPLLEGDTAEQSRTLFWRNLPPTHAQRAVRAGDFKLLLDGTLQLLFNVRSDPGERTDLAARDPARVKALKALLEEWESEMDEEARKQGTPPKLHEIQ
jgi:arylsulfatase A-like enzyme